MQLSRDHEFELDQFFAAGLAADDSETIARYIEQNSPTQCLRLLRSLVALRDSGASEDELRAFLFFGRSIRSYRGQDLDSLKMSESLHHWIAHLASLLASAIGEPSEN